MFIGEILCLFAFFIVHSYRKYRWNKEQQQNNEPVITRFNPFVFLPPTVCDIVATCISYVGLTLTSASSYQMLRGALIVCTGLLSVVGLACCSCVLGLVIVGITDIYFSDDKPGEQSNVVIGDVLCALSQIFVAFQLVTEQKFMRQYDVDPLLAVGIE
ncbi:hypothetical protein COOONC_11469, partial [Cooperia oncophora]